jgi:hypothetical protein
VQGSSIPHNIFPPQKKKKDFKKEVLGLDSSTCPEALGSISSTVGKKTKQNTKTPKIKQPKLWYSTIHSFKVCSNVASLG